MRTVRRPEEVREFCREHTADGGGPSAAACRGCGRVPVVVDREQNGSGPYRLQCPDCGIRTGESTCFPKVLDAWNGVMG